ncbi:MAG: PHP-associated domain-containing protein [Nanoarchaeota archaeon]
MSLASDLYTLVTKGFQYSANWETVKELPVFAHDLLLGATRYSKWQNRDYRYADLHVHIKDTESMRKVVDEASKRVNIMTLVTRTIESNKGHLSFEKAIDKLEEEKVEHQKLGNKVVKAYSGINILYIIRATEVYVKENQGVVIVGNDKEFEGDKLTLDDAIKASEDMGAFWFLDHPFSIGVPKIAFRYPTDEEMKMREGWFEKYNPVIEVGNHQNTLWMYPSNVLARRMARKHELAGIANSDTHFRVKEIGLSRTGIPREFFNGDSEETVLRSLQTVFSREHKDQLKIESGYSSLWSFGTYMILPTVFPKLAKKMGVRK